MCGMVLLGRDGGSKHIERLYLARKVLQVEPVYVIAVLIEVAAAENDQPTAMTHSTEPMCRHRKHSLTEVVPPMLAWELSRWLVA